MLIHDAQALTPGASLPDQYLNGLFLNISFLLRIVLERTQVIKYHEWQSACDFALHRK